jgi:Prolyl oligopeptidase, N-terminal beta-propeller domain
MKCAERWYYSYNTGLQNQSVMYSCKKPGERGEVFFDPNTLSEDGTTALSSMAFSKDGVQLPFHNSRENHHQFPTCMLQLLFTPRDTPWDTSGVLSSSVPAVVVMRVVNVMGAV